MGWWSRLFGTPNTQTHPVTVTEAAVPPAWDPDIDLAATAGGARYYRRLTESGRDLTPYDQEKQLQVAHWLYDRNYLAKRVINLYSAYVVGEGVTVQAEEDDEAIQEVIDRFWMDPINRWDLKLLDRVRDLSIAGELCLTVAVNPTDGHVRVGAIDPALIQGVLTDPLNVEIPVAVAVRGGVGRDHRYFRVVHLDDDPLSPTFGRMVGAAAGETIRLSETETKPYQGSVIYTAINKVSAGKRGRSDLFSIADLIDGYDQFLFGEIDRALLTKAFVWDVTLEGADAATLQEKARQDAPKPGTVRWHNERETWNAVSPDLKAQDASILGNIILGGVSMGSEMPKTWLSATEDVNRATAQELGEPSFKVLTARQRYLREMVAGLVTFALDQAEIAGYLPRRTGQRPEPWPFHVQMPELRPKDLAQSAATLQSAATALTTLRADGHIDQGTAQEVTVMLVGQLGIEVDLAEMRERIEQKEAEAEAKAQMAPYGDAGGQQAGANETPEPVGVPSRNGASAGRS
jgi:hypothetical protein